MGRKCYLHWLPYSRGNMHVETCIKETQQHKATYSMFLLNFIKNEVIWFICRLSCYFTTFDIGDPIFFSPVFLFNTKNKDNSQSDWKVTNTWNIDPRHALHTCIVKMQQLIKALTLGHLQAHRVFSVHRGRLLVEQINLLLTHGVVSICISWSASHFNFILWYLVINGFQIFLR